ncbi:MAG: hypothetical protein KGI25_01990 [Thaumarchaeota archaeon]|nr:hypothetical protein [Nitrososphaerota archaeon]
MRSMFYKEKYDVYDWNLTIKQIIASVTSVIFISLALDLTFAAADSITVQTISAEFYTGTNSLPSTQQISSYSFLIIRAFSRQLV